jgi:hypothetical protein
MTRFGFTLRRRAALVIVIVTSIVAGVAALGLTGELPGSRSGRSAVVAGHGAITVTDATAVALRYLAMERNEYDDWNNRMNVGPWQATADDARRRYLEMERDEFDQWLRHFALTRDDIQLQPAGEGTETIRE